METKNESSEVQSSVQSFTTIEKRFAMLERQIALLQEENAALKAGGTTHASSLKSEASPKTCDETATHLQNWLDGQQSLFENFSKLLPQLETTVLTPAKRRRLNGSGVRRLGFINTVSNVSEAYPQFWLASVRGTDGTHSDAFDFQERMKERLREMEVLRGLRIWSNYVDRVTGDLLLLAGDDAFRMANVYYSSVRVAAQGNLPEAIQVFEMIESFWQRPPRQGDEPTQKEMERDVRGLLRGTKEGTIVIRNESDNVVKGKRTFINKTRPKAKGDATSATTRFEEMETDFEEMETDLEEMETGDVE